MSNLLRWPSASILRPLLPALLLLAAPQRLPAQHALAQGFRADSAASIRLFSSAGSVLVQGWSRDSVHLAGEAAAGTTVDIRHSATEHQVEVRPASAAAGAPQLILRVPYRARVLVKGSSVDITVRGVSGSVELFTGDGDVLVDGSPASVTAETMKGVLRLRGNSPKVVGKTGAGRILFEGRARQVELSSLSGPIRAASDFQRGTFETRGGSVELVGRLARESSVQIDSQSGRVSVQAGAAPDATFSIQTVSGTIVDELAPAAGAPRDRRTEHRVVYGSGAAHVVIRTLDGPVVLRR